MIALAKKPHNTIGEKLIKPCIIKAASLALRKASSGKLGKISLFNSTMKTRIDELANGKRYRHYLFLQFTLTRQLTSPNCFSVDVRSLSRIYFD